MEKKQDRKTARPTKRRNEKRTAKPTKKTKKKISAPRERWTVSDYGKLGLEPAKLKILEDYTSAIEMVGRRTTEQTFTVGEQLHIAAGLIEDRTFGKWVLANATSPASVPRR